MAGPYEQKQQNTFNSTVKKNAGATSSGTGSGTFQPGQGMLLPGIASGYQNPKDPTVFIGPSGVASALGFGGIGEAGSYAPLSQVQNMYYTWDPKTKNKFLSQLSLAGYDTGSMKDAQLASLWAGYAEVASKYALAGAKVSPWEVIGKDISQREEAVAKPKTVTQTQKSYNLSTAEDAHALFQGAAQTLLGRDPTKAEIARFKGTLNKYEQANPTVTTTTSNYLGSDLQSQTSKSSGGVDSAAQQIMAQEEAKKNPEYGAYQAATNGMNWLMEMIGG
jgi:hypothetical protein